MTFLAIRNILKRAAVLACLMLTGCAPGPDFLAPLFVTPETYRFAKEEKAAASDLKWWELFKDPVLHELVKTALDNNKDVKIAASRIEEARAALGFTGADRYPRLDIQGGASRGNFGGGTLSPNITETYFISPVLNWEIDFWGKFRRSTEAARAELMASEYALRKVRISLIADVASTYYQLLDYRQRLEISEFTLKSRTESLNIIQQRFNNGILPEIDVNQAQIQREIAAGAIPRFERLIAQTENALSTLLGELPGGIRRGVPLERMTITPGIPAGLPSQLLTRRPDIMEALYRLKAQNERIGVAEAQRFPAISLTGVLGLASTELSTMTVDGDAWSIGAGLFGPLYDFGKNKRRVEIEEARTRQALFAYERTVLTAFREVEDALVETDTYRREIASVGAKLKAARNAGDLSRERYDRGVSSYLEVLENERTLFDVKLELSDVTQRYFNAYVKLYKALGCGWISPEEAAAAKASE